METETIPSTIPSLVSQNVDLFACPVCGASLSISQDGQAMRCSECSHTFECENGIPLMFWPNEWDSKTDVTEVVKSFYEENPFPNYEDMDSEWSLREKAEQGIFARLLDEQIAHGAKVLEVGCGTGQLSNFLGLRWGRSVFGADICLNSLKLGQGFKQDNQVDNTAFVQMNLFRPVFKPESFDLVICNGVLHHTSDPFLGFESISRLVKKGGTS
ncbi:MAG: methyltransferase domain-containing protein [Chloroflexi bacterium]|nr:methyltransferase domain-containing protein [Chloroflexota bacterium]